MTSTSHERSTPKKILDVFVYAPIGLAISVSDEVPRLASKGRTRIETQLSTARVVGELAANYGIQRVDKQIKQVLSAGLDRYLGFKYPEQEQPKQDRGQESKTVSMDHGKADDPSGREVDNVKGLADDNDSPISKDDSSVNTERGSDISIEERDLAIPGYDALSASQVVQRLDGLSAEELKAVREYEATHRARRTILNKASHLLDDR